MKPLFPDVTVNGEAIAPAAINAEAQNHKAPAGKPGLAWRAAAKAMAIRALLLQEARRLGMAAEPQLVGTEKLETDDEALIRALLEQEIEPEEVSEQACEALYESRVESFRSPSLFQPAHILFAAQPADKEARQAAKQNALAALAVLKNDPKAFARIAKANSDCQSRGNGGSLGQVGSGDTVAEFEAVLQTLPAGVLHPDPVETRFGFHVIRMDERAEGAQLPFDAVKVQIREKLEQIAWASAANALTQRLVDQAEIVGIDLNQPIETAA
jgi:peptidyl-prolyl cis-trans isomerase C